ncbi:ankyrin repeat-containing protein BDA1-like [Spinacia oleracea]|uniref:Ankyrin repeat-containing protein BDA1-like n=1 Tax=Spinacia oleracea TaxID=3562 RepID=A0ABM3QZH1_SPIOL|nr:ankyrin repeat-containing protein BDA1-like [Spinacia oleracea]
MERKLYDAAREGSVSSLLKLLEEDPIILDRVSNLGIYAETPLHIATILGNFEFAKELLKRKPNFAFEVDLQKSTPLHLASATNNIELVTLLLSVANSGSICRCRDAYGRYPVHVAAIRGRIHVLKELLRVDHDAALVLMDQNETIFHLCVKFNQFEALKFLMIQIICDAPFLNCGDTDGNTILHLSVLDKQYERNTGIKKWGEWLRKTMIVISYLLQSKTIDVNATNAKGQTAMDILYMGLGGTIGHTLQCLHNAGAVVSNHSSYNNVLSSSSSPSPIVENNNKLLMSIRKPSLLRFLEDKQEAVMIAASLIAAAAFQAGVTPPGGIHSDTVDLLRNGTFVDVKSKHIAGTSIVAYSNPRLYTAFIVENTVGFVAALSVFLLVLTGLPQRYKFFKGFFMVSIWIAIVAIAASYFSSVITVAPPPVKDGILVFSYVVLVIAVLMWVAIILWYAGLGPRIVGIIKQKRTSTNTLIRSISLHGTTGATRRV